MEKKSPFGIVPPEPSPEKAMEGRFIDKQGKDHGDRDFHEKALGFDEAAEQSQLSDLEEFTIKQKEDRAEQADQADAKAIYTFLVKHYPTHSRASIWKTKL